MAFGSSLWAVIRFRCGLQGGTHTKNGIESESEVIQSCPTLCDPMDCNLPGSSVHGIFQAIVLEWIAISFSNVREITLNLKEMKILSLNLLWSHF